MPLDFEILIVIENYFRAFLIIFISLLLDKFIPLSNNSNPLVFFNILFDRIAIKVNSVEPKQSTIAGALSLTSLLLPLLIIIYLVREFAHYQFIIDILLLWISLQYTHDVLVIKQTYHALLKDKKELAKSLLATKVLRDTAPLSKLGIIKASMECAYLRYQHQKIAPIIMFIFLGPIASIFYRLIYEAHHRWHTKLEKFRYFGKAAFFFSKLVQLPSSLLFNLMFLLFFNAKTFCSMIFNRKVWLEVSRLFVFEHQTLNLWVLTAVQKKEIGGPVMYGGKKQPRKRHNMLLSGQNTHEPDANDLYYLLNKMTTFTYIFICAVGMLSLCRFLYDL